MKKLQQLSLWGSLGTLCLVLSPSCDDDSANHDGDDGDGGGGGETTDTDAVTSIKKTIGPAGGTVEIDGVSLTFPPGALAKDTEIQLGYLSNAEIDALPGLPTGASSRSTPVAMKPHGLEFNEPVQASMAYAGTSASLVVGRLESEDDETWEATGETQFADGKATFSLNAFSIYSVVEDPEGGLSDEDAPGTGGTNGSGGGSNAGCEANEWLDPVSGDCNSCEAHTHVCADFIDASGVTSLGTSWESDTNTLTFELREGLPPISFAALMFTFNGDLGSYSITRQMTIDDNLLTASFTTIEDTLSYSSNAVLGVVDVCGNESTVTSEYFGDGESLSWERQGDDGDPYHFYCE